jgi:hypothetical protein
MKLVANRPAVGQGDPGIPRHRAHEWERKWIRSGTASAYDAESAEAARGYEDADKKPTAEEQVGQDLTRDPQD